MEGWNWSVTKSWDVLLVFKGRSLFISWKRWLRLQMFLLVQIQRIKNKLLESWQSPSLLRNGIGSLQRIVVWTSGQMFPKSQINPWGPSRNRISRYSNNFQQHWMLFLHVGPSKGSAKLLQDSKGGDDCGVRGVPWEIDDYKGEYESL